MIILTATFALSMHLAAPVTDVADNLPRFNVEPLCRGIAQQGGLDLEPDQTISQSIKSCVKSEMLIRDRLLQQWSGFGAADKANCIAEASAGGVPSYTELLTCLQMAQDVRRIGDYKGMLGQ